MPRNQAGAMSPSPHGTLRPDNPMDVESPEARLLAEQDDKMVQSETDTAALG